MPVPVKYRHRPALLLLLVEHPCVRLKVYFYTHDKCDTIDQFYYAFIMSAYVHLLSVNNLNLSLVPTKARQYNLQSCMW
jgi:hypothetical protein